MLANKPTVKQSSSYLPQYTIRMLVKENSPSENYRIFQKKMFRHVTLACTAEDKTPIVTVALHELSHFFNGSISFVADEVINLRNTHNPLWAVKLNLGHKEQEIREKLSSLFDPIMCPEKNGILYLWKSQDNLTKKCPHITIGPRKEDEEIAKNLLLSKFKFSFEDIDYKKIGPHDPIFSVKLINQCNNEFQVK